MNTTFDIAKQSSGALPSSVSAMVESVSASIPFAMEQDLHHCVSLGSLYSCLPESMPTLCKMAETVAISYPVNEPALKLKFAEPTVIFSKPLTNIAIGSGVVPG